MVTSRASYTTPRDKIVFIKTKALAGRRCCASYEGRKVEQASEPRCSKASMVYKIYL